MMRPGMFSLPCLGCLWAFVLVVTLVLPAGPAAALSESERQHLTALAGEWGEIAQIEGPVAADPRDLTQPPKAIERALAGAAMGDAVVNIIERAPDQMIEAVAAAVVLAPALSDPIVTRVARAYPDRRDDIMTAAAVAVQVEAESVAEAPSPAPAETAALTETAAPAEQEAITPAEEEVSAEPQQFAEIEAALYEEDGNEAEELDDPYEGFNRFVFAFNDLLDTIMLRPLAALYGFVAPTEVKGAVRKFYRNLNEPVVFANKLLQFEGEDALITLGRFAVNSTAGGAGFFEVAEDWDLPPQSADFGQTLHGWGVGRGNYLMIPLVGPSNTRYGVGRIVDILMNPRTWLLPLPANGGLTGGYALSVREQLLQPLDQLRTGSIDYYTAIKSVYWQNRLRTLRGEQSGDEFTIGGEDLDSDFDSIE